MADDDQFEPRLGRLRDLGTGRRARTFLHRVLAAANLARGGAPTLARRSGFTGSRLGRGAGVGRVLAARDAYAAFRQRRVIVKARIVRLAGKGLAAAQAHMRYLVRDGTTREGESGMLYGAHSDAIDRAQWTEQANGDRHLFRFIVSAEDGDQYADLKPLTRRLMARMEEDLGTRLDWAAVDHFNTGHPHTHIVLRGKDERGADLVIARDYLSHGLRERAAELVDLDLGPRSDRAIAQRLRVEVTQERLTSIDRSLILEARNSGLVGPSSRGAFDRTLRLGRLQVLARLGLAHPADASHWRLAPDLADTLQRMGERGDIIRTMQRAYAARSDAPALADRTIYDPAAHAAPALVGRIVERGLADELDDRHYLIVEASDGRVHYVAIGRGDTLAPIATGAIVRVAPATHGIREADRTIAVVAAANDGRYSIDAHLKHDRRATQAYAESHVRRLEAMRRLARTVERASDGSWAIAPDHLERAAAYEALRARDRPVTIDVLSARPLEQLVRAEAATWLDTELVATSPEVLRDAGFGLDVRAALALRRQWLIEQGLAEEQDGEIACRANLIATLRRRELLRVAGQLADELGLPFVEARTGARVEGRLGRMIELTSGRFALVEKSREFTLVPWRPVLERQIGKAVAGIVREEGISWTFGRERGGPAIG